MSYIDLEASRAIGSMLCFWRHAIIPLWMHATFLELCYIFGGMLRFWSRATFLEACYISGGMLHFAGMVSIRMHAMFLEACLANRRHAPIDASIML